MRYLPHTEEDISSMLAVIGVHSIDDLFTQIPPNCRMEAPLKLPAALSEWELNDHMDGLAGAMGVRPEYKTFIGAGCYDHYVPSVISHLLSRSEFLTAYTPYQPEVSQGTLQGIYEYQTLVCRLLGMETANASLYDGASALAEGILMALRITGKKRAVISKAVHPFYREVVKTYLASLDFELTELPCTDAGVTDLRKLEEISGLAAIAVQSPNYFGCIEDIGKVSVEARRREALSVITFSEPLAYGLLKNPGSLGADIVCGEGKSFGLSQNFGGMSLGIFAAKMKYVRNMPGRIIGKTVDRDGRDGFVITLSTREQHIRREKATSNICSNQSLCALGAAMYLSCLGKTGIRELARLNFNKTEYLKAKLKEAGISIRFPGPTFNEFVAEFPEGCEDMFEKLLDKKIAAGISLGEEYPEMKNCRLVCVTETKTRDDLDSFVKEVKTCLNHPAHPA
jgi:glycine dehydrogenase subunit 1